MAQDGAGSLAALTASGNAPGAAPSLELMAIGGYATYGHPSLSAATATGTSTSASVATIGDTSVLPAMTGSGSGSAGAAASGAGSFAEMTAAAYGPTGVALTLGAMTGSGTGLTGGAASAALYLRSPTATAAGIGGSMATAAPSFPYPTADATSAQTNVGTAALTLRMLVGAGTSLVGTIATASPSFEQMTAAAAAQATNVATAAPAFATMRAYGVASSVLADTRRTWVLNVGNDALTEYQNHDFDGYAYFNGKYYGSGPDGIFLLEGTDDDGVDIAWSFRTGLMDGKMPGLKRLEELLIAMEVNGPVRVRIWVDGDVYYDYTISNFRPGVIQQVRTKLGKGLRSRYFRVQVSGIGTVAAEIMSMQLPFLELRRRVG